MRRRVSPRDGAIAVLHAGGQAEAATACVIRDASSSSFAARWATASPARAPCGAAGQDQPSYHNGRGVGRRAARPRRPPVSRRRCLACVLVGGREPVVEGAERVPRQNRAMVLSWGPVLLRVWRACLIRGTVSRGFLLLLRPYQDRDLVVAPRSPRKREPLLQRGEGLPRFVLTREVGGRADGGIEGLPRVRLIPELGVGHPQVVLHLGVVGELRGAV